MVFSEVSFMGWYPSPYEFARAGRRIFASLFGCVDKKKQGGNRRALRTRADVDDFWGSYERAAEKARKGERKKFRIK